MFLHLPKSKFAFVSFIISTLLVIISLILIIRIFPDVITTEIYKSVRLVKGTEQYDRFLELPFPVTFKVYLFNVENPSQILKGAKPLVREVGPYIYKEYRKKTVIATDEENDTVSYIQNEKFEFDYEASGKLSDEDSITVLNIPLMSTLQIADNYGQAGLISKCLKDIFSDLNSLFITVKVKDILFDGIHFCHKHFSFCEFSQTLVCKMISKKKNVDILDDGSLKFSFFNYKNKSDDGLYTIKRGIKNVQALGQIITLNNLKYTKFWTRLGVNSICDEIKGTDSTLYPPQIRKDSVFESYSTDICRSIKIRFSEETVYQGIEGFLFSTDNSTLRSEHNDNNNDCFCAKQTKGVYGNDTCFLDGVMDLQPCFGAPVLLSFPHFLWAGEAYIQNVDGMSPDEKNHKTYLIVEPETGTPLQGLKRVQINTVMRPFEKVKGMEMLPRVVFPLVWIEEGVSLSDEYITKLEDLYFHKVLIVNIIKWTLLGTSIMFTAIFGVCMIRKQIM